MHLLHTYMQTKHWRQRDQLSYTASRYRNAAFKKRFKVQMMGRNAPQFVTLSSCFRDQQVLVVSIERRISLTHLIKQVSQTSQETYHVQPTPNTILSYPS